MEDNKTLGVKDIAKLANVSIGTVDRVIHNRDGVSLKTKEKILAIIRKHKYEPNIIAQSLTKKNIKVFKVIIPKASMESSYWDGPLHGINKGISEIEKYGMKVDILSFDQNDIQSFNKLINDINLRTIHGLIVAPMFKEQTIELITKCEEASIPYVFINSDLNPSNPIAYYGPDLQQSGLAIANLIDYTSSVKDEILIVNISKELYPEHHLYIKQDAFLSYFKSLNNKREIKTLDIRSTDYNVINNALKNHLNENRVKVIFVTNSRVSSVAAYLFEEKIHNNYLLIGFDYLEDNIKFLEKQVIDFLICHKPVQQGYLALLHLFNHVRFGKANLQKNYMPIDIISRYNHTYYDN